MFLICTRPIVQETWENLISKSEIYRLRKGPFLSLGRSSSLTRLIITPKRLRMKGRNQQVPKVKDPSEINSSTFKAAISWRKTKECSWRTLIGVRRPMAKSIWRKEIMTSRGARVREGRRHQVSGDIRREIWLPPSVSPNLDLYQECNMRQGTRQSPASYPRCIQHIADRIKIT